MKKRCTKCHKLKSRDKFYKSTQTNDGLRSSCKICMSKDQRALRERRNPSAKKILSYNERHRTVNKIDQKLCSRCSVWKPLSKYRKDSRRRDDRQSHCNKCLCEQNKIYQKEHKTEIILYRQTHKVEAAEWSKKYRQTLNGYLRSCYYSLNRRCNSSNFKQYKDYGGRGIKNLFKSFGNFYQYVTINLELTYNDIKGKQIDRINNDGHYKPGNIQFLTRAKHLIKHRKRKERNKR